MWNNESFWLVCTPFAEGLEKSVLLQTLYFGPCILETTLASHVVFFVGQGYSKLPSFWAFIGPLYTSPGWTTTRVSPASNFQPRWNEVVEFYIYMSPCWVRARSILGDPDLTRFSSFFARLKGLLTTCHWGKWGTNHAIIINICVNVISYFTNVICLCAAAWVFNAYDYAELTFFFPHTLHACRFASAIFLQAAHGQERWTAKRVTFKRAQVRWASVYMKKLKKFQPFRLACQPKSLRGLPAKGPWLGLITVFM